MLILLTVSREHALHAQFLRRDALRRTDSCDQRKVGEALLASPKHDRAERDFGAQAAASTLQRRDIPATAPAGSEVPRPVPAPQLPAEPFAAGRPQPSPTPRQRAASPPDRTSDREDSAALAWPPDRQMSRRIAERLHWFEPHSSTGPAQAPDEAHVVAASDRSPASRSPSARHPHSVRCTEEHILMPAAEHSARGAECSRHRKQ